METGRTYFPKWDNNWNYEGMEMVNATQENAHKKKCALVLAVAGQLLSLSQFH